MIGDSYVIDDFDTVFGEIFGGLLKVPNPYQAKNIEYISTNFGGVTISNNGGRGMIGEIEPPLLMKFDPAYGTQTPYPSEAAQYRAYHGAVAWLYCPYTGRARDAMDVGSDTFGHLLTIKQDKMEA